MTKAEKNFILRRLEEMDNNRKRKSHLEFMKHTWRKGKKNPMVEGFHTKVICDRIDKAFEDFRNGKSTYLKISVHHRSGKSDILSRYLPPHFLGEFPDCEVMSTTYKKSLTEKFTSFARNVFRSAKYKELYPGLALSKESNAKSYWEIVHAKTQESTNGSLFGSGLSSGITGSGGHLVLVDDPLSGRRDAESLTIRNGVWETLTDDLLTRLAPTHIVIMLGTQWHYDDPSARLENEMKKDPDFPQFEILRFPARAKDYKGPGKYPNEYLFEERYSKKWYRTQYATLGKYGAAALLDCDPIMRSGNILSTDGIVWIESNDPSIPTETGAQWARVWDLAHTLKQRTGGDPDWTAGTLMAFTYKEGDDIPHLWIKHAARFRFGATKRDQLIRMHAQKDGRFAKQCVETSIDSKDAFQYLKNSISDISWTDIDISGDKVVRCAPLEPIFETIGHVHVVRGAWNDAWLDEILKFDGSDSGHDDQIDNLSAGHFFLVSKKARMFPKEIRDAMAARRRR